MTRPNYIKNLRDLLVADSTLTGLVSASSINVSWKKKDIPFPCIVITQIGARAVGRLGIAQSDSGERMVDENITFRIDIASRTSITNINNIADAINGILMVEGYEKMGEIDTFDENKNTYIRTLTFRLVDVYSY